MLLDFDVRTCSRQCAATGKALQPGDVYFSALVLQAAVTEAGAAAASSAAETEAIRHDYSAEAWQGPPADNLGWWRSRVPLKNENRSWPPATLCSTCWRPWPISRPTGSFAMCWDCY